MSFAVVHFIEEDQYSEVPSNWLIDDRKCYWPPRNVKNYSSLIKNRVEPSEDWEVFEIAIETFCESLEAARNKAADIEYTSSEEKGRGKRKIYHVNPRASSSDEDSAREASITPPPALKIDGNGALRIQAKKSFSIPPTGPRIDENKRFKPQNVDICQSIMNAEVIFQNDESLEIEAKNPSERNEEINSRAQPNCGRNDDMENLTRTTVKILKIVTDIHKRLDRLEKKNDTSKWNIFRDKLPCNSVQEVNSLDFLLESDQSLCYFKEFVSSIGGLNPRDRVNRVMKTLLKNEFGISCSWLGQRNNIKASDFKCLQISKDVLLEYMTSAEFDSHASEWLRLARLRHQREEKKNDS